eukprot:jgi/Mesen1/1779/ME000014S01194
MAYGCSACWPSLVTFVSVTGLLLCGLPSVLSERPDTGPIRIDCGSDAPSTQNGLDWEADRGYPASSVAANISDTGENGSALGGVAASLRAFPNASDSCYVLHVPAGRYLVRLGFAYSDYDGLSAPPAFNVTLGGATVEAVDLLAQQELLGGNATAYETDYVAFFSDGTASICFVSVTGSPVVSSLELLPADSEAYTTSQGGTDVILSTIARVNAGGEALGPEPADLGYRSWIADLTAQEGNYSTLATNASVAGAGIAPDWLPQGMLQTARDARISGNIGFAWPLQPVGPPSPLPAASSSGDDITSAAAAGGTNSWLLVLYFAEIDASVARGERLCDILIGEQGFLQYDILGNASSSSFTAQTVSIELAFPPAASGTLNTLLLVLVRSNGSTYDPILNGLELFEIVRTAAADDDATDPTGSADAAAAGGDDGFLFPADSAASPASAPKASADGASPGSDDTAADEPLAAAAPASTSAAGAVGVQAKSSGGSSSGGKLSTPLILALVAGGLGIAIALAICACCVVSRRAAAKEGPLLDKEALYAVGAGLFPTSSGPTSQVALEAGLAASRTPYERSDGGTFRSGEMEMSRHPV